MNMYIYTAPIRQSFRCSKCGWNGAHTQYTLVARGRN